MHTTLAQADDNSGSSTLVFPSSLPTFHLYGARDVFLAESRDHATLYDGAVSFCHDAGHEIPKRLELDNALSQALASFLCRFKSSQAKPVQVNSSQDEPSRFLSVESATPCAGRLYTCTVTGLSASGGGGIGDCDNRDADRSEDRQQHDLTGAPWHLPRDDAEQIW